MDESEKIGAVNIQNLTNNANASTNISNSQLNYDHDDPKSNMSACSSITKTIKKALKQKQALKAKSQKIQLIQTQQQDVTPTVQDVSFTSPTKMDSENHDALSAANKSNNYEGTE